MSEEVKTANGDKDKPKIVINTKLFWSRLRHFYEVWRTGAKLWGATGGASGAPDIVDAVILCYGPDDEETEYSRSLAIQLALFGYEITETILVFTQDVLYVVTGPKKGRILEPLGERDGDTGNLRLKLLLTGKGADKNDKIQQHYTSLIKYIKASRKGKRVGYVEKAPRKGALVTGFISTLEKHGLELVDVSSGLANVLSVKDRDALACIKKASQFSSQVMRKFLIPELETVIDEEKTVIHSEFADRVDDVIRDPAKVRSELRASDVDSCYSPIIMSGGKYDLKPSAASNGEQLDYGTIICQLGARYKNYCSNIGRTFFINPTEDQHATYLLLIEVYQAALAAMKPKNKLTQVYQAAQKVIQTKKPELLEKFTQNCGFGLGLEFRESSLVLNDKNPRLLAPGMTFNLVMGFDRLECPDKDDPAKTRHYAVLLSDTVMITEDEAETLTACPRKYAEIAYFTGGDEKAEDVAAPTAEESKEPTARGVTRDRLRTSNINDEEETEKKRRQHQEELARKKQEEAMRKFAADQADRMFNAAPSLKDGKIKSYESPAYFPPEAKENRIYVDHKAETLLLPINDQLVPFHIASVKNVHKTEEGQYTMLRINFSTPDQPMAKSGDFPTASTYKYLREIVYRTTTGSLDKVFFDIKELRKRVQDRSKEYEAKRNIVAQQELRLDKAPNPPRLKDIFVKPQISKKKQTSGILTAHLNGLRYITLDKQKIDIIYDNIASAFYQPAEQTHAVLLHFELKNPILLDNTKTKKTNFVQFFVEVVESSEDLASTNRYRDEDGLQEEQEERMRRKKWNERFLDFVKLVEEAATKKAQVELEFDIPYRELSFSGVPNKQVVTIMPTVKSLIALDDQPPLVIPLSEIEIANCERVQFGLRNFDLVFVWKDFSKPVVTITGIPTQDLAKVKNWLDSCDILTFESAQNLNWKNVMKSVNEDVKTFYSEGGWSFLNDHVGDEGGGDGGDDEEGGGDGEANESDFAPSEDESDSEEYETPSSEGSGEDEEDSEISDESEEDQGESWEELEEKAKRSDRNKGHSDSEDEDRKRPVKKMKPAQRR